MSLPDDIHFINCTHENLPSSIFTDYQLKMRMELMRRRGQQKLNPEKLGCNIVPKLFCWLPKLYYRGVSLEFLDYVLETTTADGKFCLVSFIDPFYYADPNEFCTQCLRPYRSDAYSGGMVDPRLVKPFDYRFMDFLSCQ